MRASIALLQHLRWLGQQRLSPNSNGQVQLSNNAGRHRRPDEDKVVKIIPKEVISFYDGTKKGKEKENILELLDKLEEAKLFIFPNDEYDASCVALRLLKRAKWRNCHTDVYKDYWRPKAEQFAFHRRDYFISWDIHRKQGNIFFVQDRNERSSRSGFLLQKRASAVEVDFCSRLLPEHKEIDQRLSSKDDVISNPDRNYISYSDPSAPGSRSYTSGLSTSSYSRFINTSVSFFSYTGNGSTSTSPFINWAVSRSDKSAQREVGQYNTRDSIIYSSFSPVATVIYLDNNGNGNYDQGEEISVEATRTVNFQTTVTMSKKLKGAEIVTGTEASNKFGMRYTLTPTFQANQDFIEDQDTVVVDLWGTPTYPAAANSSAKIAIIVLFSVAQPDLIEEINIEGLRLYVQNHTAQTGLVWRVARVPGVNGKAELTHVGRCWKGDPRERPNFAHICGLLGLEAPEDKDTDNIFSDDRDPYVETNLDEGSRYEPVTTEGQNGRASAHDNGNLV
ncbi:hypothetical protein PROFUN_05288 [Planoprotostelium fungivorum]|uniref:Uncharacterized protein n=1 Tax=Planoprotostelium fungivorum TaxID=1890364 RepID=A0A2P6NRB7_9EUKA|nr:hypothetical protein PROFUN_05288 [Planoprotostelium fungivorum]